MAFPQIPTGGRVVVGNQANNTGTRTFPSLTGLTKNAGDLLIAICVGYQSSGTSNAVFSSWGASFTEFVDQMTTSATTMCIGAAYKWSDGTETGTFTVTQAATVTGYASFILLSIADAHPTTPPEAGPIADGTTAAADPPTVLDPTNWGTEDTLWIAVAGCGETNATGAWAGTTAGPTNYTNYADSGAADTSTVGECDAAVAFRQNRISAENVGTFTVDTSNARNSALLLAVRQQFLPVPELTMSALQASRRR